MYFKYFVDYWYRDDHTIEQRGTYYTNDLTDLYAFMSGIKRRGGWTRSGDC